VPYASNSSFLDGSFFQFVFLTVLIFLGQALAEEVTIYDKDWRVNEGIQDGTIYDRNWNTKGYIKKGK